MYPPDYISYRTQTMTVEDLLYGLRNGNIDDYDVIKCNNSLILPRRRSQFIESVIIGLPLLPLVFDGSRAPWYIIDGVKRLSVIRSFAKNEIQLEETSYSRLQRYTYFRGMSPFLQNRFLKAPIPCYIINPGTPPDIVNDIQDRIQIML